jgi:predicted ATPase
MVLRLADELLDALGLNTSKPLVLQAHHAAWTGHWMCGRLETGVRHAEMGLELYRRETHHALAAHFTGHDAGVCCRFTLGIASQLLGYPERARDRMADSLALADSLAHPQTQIIALTLAGCMYIVRRDVAQVRELATAGIEICREQGVPTFGAGFELMAAWAEAMLGGDGDVRPRFAHAIAAMEERRFLVRRSFYLGTQAAVCLVAGAYGDGLAAVEAALTFVHAHGERWYEPELHRLKGELILGASRDRREEAEATFLHAIEAARTNGARWFELRAVTSLARFWADAGKRQRAHGLLAAAYGWFTEGLETPDLKDAKALLKALS